MGRTTEKFDTRGEVQIPITLARQFLMLAAEQVEITAGCMGRELPPDPALAAEQLRTEEACLVHLREKHGVTLDLPGFRIVMAHAAMAMVGMLEPRLERLAEAMNQAEVVIKAGYQTGLNEGALKLEADPLRGRFRVTAAPVPVRTPRPPEVGH